MSANPFSAPTPPPLPTSQPASPSRPRFVTALAWPLIVLSALLLPISMITMLMIMTGSYGTENINLMDFLNVVVRPPATLIAGIGLLRRWRWAHTYSIALLAAFGLWHATIMARGSSPERTYTSPSGVRTTTLATTVNYPAHIAGLTITLLVLAKLRSRPIREYFNSARPPATQRTQPRPTTFHPLPATHLHPANATTTASRVMLDATRPRQKSGLLAFLTFLAVIGLGAGGFVLHSLATAETYFPSKRATNSRQVHRDQEPVHYWASVTLYSIVSLGTLGLAAFCAREALRIDISGRGKTPFPRA